MFLIRKMTCIHTETPIKMPNIDYALMGYDIYFGNPARTSDSGSTPDPGFKQPIFEASYSKGKVTGDGRFKVPNGMSLVSCNGDCNLEFTSQSMSGLESYTKSLDVKVSAEGSGWEGRFSASTDYKHVDSSTKSSQSLFTHSEISCCAYTASILEYDTPALSQNFIKGVKTLPINYDREAYRRFLDTFGTHYVNTVHMGATYGQQSKISSSSWKEMLENNVNIAVSAGYSGKMVILILLSARRALLYLVCFFFSFFSVIFINFNFFFSSSSSKRQIETFRLQSSTHFRPI